MHKLDSGANFQSLQLAKLEDWDNRVVVRLDPRLQLCDWEFCVFSVFFFFLVLMNSNLSVHACDYTVRETKLLFANCSNTVHALFIGPTITLFKKNIKNWSHGTIHTFKNYFVIVFSVFSFSKNKLYPNGPWISLEIWHKTFPNTPYLGKIEAEKAINS